MLVANDLQISFSEEDAAQLHQPHNDALVVSLNIVNIKVHRVLVDGGSSANVLSLSVFNAMRLGWERLRSRLNPLVGFGGHEVYPEGSIELSVTFGDGMTCVTAMVNFLVVDDKSIYNAVLGRPTLHQMRAVPSTYYQVMKFPTPGGVGVIRGEQLISRECY